MRIAIRLNDFSLYTEQLCANVDTAFVDADKTTKAALGTLQRDLHSAASALMRARTVVSASRTRLTRAAIGTSAPLAEAGAVLRGFRHHLSGLAHLKLWDGSVVVFFGGAQSVPRAHQRVVAALRAAIASLKADDSIADRAAWLKRLEGPYTALGSAVQETKRTFDELRGNTTALARKREEWRVQYDLLLKVARGHLLIARRDAEVAALDPSAVVKSRNAAAKRGRARAAARRRAIKQAVAAEAPVIALAKAANDQSAAG